LLLSAFTSGAQNGEGGGHGLSIKVDGETGEVEVGKLSVNSNQWKDGK